MTIEPDVRATVISSAAQDRGHVKRLALAHIRDAEDEARRAALEEAARYVERCDTSMMSVITMLQIVTTDQVAAGIRALKDEPQVSAAEPPLKAVEIPAIPGSKG